MAGPAKTDANDIAIRAELAKASDDLLISRSEVAIFLGIMPAAVSNATLAGRIPQPQRLGTGKRSLARWRLGDLRSAFHRPDSK